MNQITIKLTQKAIVEAVSLILSGVYRIEHTDLHPDEARTLINLAAFAELNPGTFSPRDIADMLYDAHSRRCHEQRPRLHDPIVHAQQQAQEQAVRYAKAGKAAFDTFRQALKS